MNVPANLSQQTAPIKPKTEAEKPNLDGILETLHSSGQDSLAVGMSILFSVCEGTLEEELESNNA